MEKILSPDYKRVRRTLSIYEHAKEILLEEGGNPRVTFGAAILHDVYKFSREKYGDSNGRNIVLEILEKLKVSPNEIDDIFAIMSNYDRLQHMDMPEFNIFWDAA